MLAYINLRAFLPALALALLTTGGAVPVTAAREKPNVIFILIDDLGYGDLGCTGNRTVPTPNIDRLAAEGTRLTQFHVSSPICSPSRVAFTTGQYPRRWRVHSFLNDRAANRRRGMADILDSRAPAMARAFKAAGYATAHFGRRRERRPSGEGIRASATDHVGISSGPPTWQAIRCEPGAGAS